MLMSKYVRVTEGLKDFGDLIPLEELDRDLVSEKDCYTSVFYYNEEQYKQFKKTGSVKGITDVYTDKLVFDFDSKTDLNLAKQDANTLVERLNKNNIENKNIDVYFSGSKGFTVIVNLNHELNPTQAATLALKKFGKDLTTLDPSMYNASRILRLPNTKHQVTGLYKVQLTLNQLKKLSIDTIKEVATKAKQLEEKEKVSLTAELLKVEEPKKEIKEVKSQLERRPPHWKDYKWALLQGQFEPGERHNALMIIAATCRGLGYDEELTRAMCTSSDEKFCSRTKSKPSDDIDSSIKSVFDEGWNGGQYSYKNNAFLQQYCARNGFQVNASDDELTVEINEVYDLFKDYAKNIDKLTVHTGIPELDNKFRMTIGMTIGIVAAPGVGKTSISLQILNSMSNRNEQCLFFSYDMYHSLVFQKLVQKHFDMQPEDIFEKFKNGDAEFERIVLDKIKEEYHNVEFCFRQGQNPDDMIQTIKHTKEKTGKDVRLVVVDYNELVMSNFSDATQSSAYIAQRLREIANTFNCCVIVLLQPNKLSGSPSDELTSYRATKGSSAIEQSLSVMLGISRPGYSPKHPEEDKFLVINCLKNRMGRLFRCELHWEGLTGTVREMTDEERSLLREIENRKKEEAADKDKDWN